MKSSLRFRLLLGVLLISGLAMAAASSGPIAIDLIQRWMKGGLYIGPTATTVSTNKVTQSCAALQSWDFPACATSGFAAITICNQHTNGFACTGAAIGDECGVTSDHSIADGGIPDSVFFTASVLQAGLVAVREHYMATDAGVYDAPDSGYEVRCWSHL